MQQWIKCIFVLAWKMPIVGAQCPSGFTCSGVQCYLIYPTSSGWKVETPIGTKDAEGSVYASPNCYKFIRVNKKSRSCIDAQHECEQLGGNITVINGIEEYEQLTNNVLHTFGIGVDSIFSVHVQNLPLDNIRTGCTTVTVEDGIINSVRITDTDCATTRMVNSIVCESTGVHTGICPVPGATETTPTPTVPVHHTSHIWPTATQSFVTDKTSSGYTSIGFTHPSTETLSEMIAGSNLWIVAVIVPSVVVTIAMFLLSFLLIRRRERRTKPGNDKPADKVEYQDYVAEDVHEYATHNAVVQNQNTIGADEVVYQDVKDDNEYLYHNTAAVEVVYHDTAVEVAYHNTAPVEELYHDTAVEVVYQNSDVDRSKRTGKRKGIAHAIVGGQTSSSCGSQPLSHKDSDRHQKVTSSPDYVDIPYENSIRASGSRGRGNGSEFQFSEDYSEIDACKPNENNSTEQNNYLQIIG